MSHQCEFCDELLKTNLDCILCEECGHFVAVKGLQFHNEYYHQITDKEEKELTAWKYPWRVRNTIAITNMKSPVYGRVFVRVHNTVCLRPRGGYLPIVEFF